jgi:hypothetical protein
MQNNLVTKPSIYMNFSLFKMLDVAAQAQAICDCGVMLGERKEDDYWIVLYQLDSFYVEVYYRLQDDEIVKFRSFHSVKFLEPYLNTINIGDVEQCCHH